ncbi:MAG: DUF2783 domain-containing protein [Burkholderiaceae bacterium]|nr:DUF2783 domain-containing protein [Burkholderiaceae bacterium]
MSHLKTTPNIAEPDRFYERLIDLHRDLDEEASAAANARLILVLANHIGDIEVLEEALALAARSGKVPDYDAGARKGL